MHGIEARLGDIAKIDGKVEIAIIDANDPAKIMVSITDNGIGLNDENYLSFKTQFSGHKLKARDGGLAASSPSRCFREFRTRRYMSCWAMPQRALIPHPIVLAGATRVEHTNSWRFMLRDRVWSLDGVTMLPYRSRKLRQKSRRLPHELRNYIDPTIT